MKKLLVIDIVGLSKNQFERLKPKNITSILDRGQFTSFESSFPAVTCSVQASIFSGTYPSEHGIIANGYYDKTFKQISFWEQPSDLVKRPRIWDTLKKNYSNFSTGLLFLQNSLYANSDIIVTPKPLHLDQKITMWCYSKPKNFYEEISNEIGSFDLKSYWGPFSSIASSLWIIKSAKISIEKHQPDFLNVYLPHLDYAAQKFGPNSIEFENSVRELDLLIGDLLDFLNERFPNLYEILLLSEYSFNDVESSISPNTILRQFGFLDVNIIDGKEYIDFESSKAFAMVDHQISHVYIKSGYEKEIYKIFKNQNIGEILDNDSKKKFHIDHPNSGDLILCSQPNSWFNYFWWEDEKFAPDFTFNVDIHRKPGYDPLELFLDYETKKISHDTSLIRGSHGLIPVNPNDSPLIGTSFDSNLDGNISITKIKQIIENFFRN